MSSMELLVTKFHIRISPDEFPDASKFTFLLNVNAEIEAPFSWKTFSGEEKSDVLKIMISPSARLQASLSEEPDKQMSVISMGDKDLNIIGADRATTIIHPTLDTGASGDARGWFLVDSGIEFNLESNCDVT